MPATKLLLWGVGVMGTVDMLLLRQARPDKSRQLPTVPHVDLERFMGKWFEIARHPIPSERRCVAASAEYALRPDGKIAITNSCRKGSIAGPVKQVRGTAWVVDKNTNAKLKVQFVWPFSSDYWVFDLGKEYEYAVVGDPKSKRLWILSREPQMDESTYQSLLNHLKRLGHDTTWIIRTPQPK